MSKCLVGCVLAYRPIGNMNIMVKCWQLIIAVFVMHFFICICTDWFAGYHNASVVMVLVVTEMLFQCCPLKTLCFPTSTSYAALQIHHIASDLFWYLCGTCAESKHTKKPDEWIYMPRIISKIDEYALFLDLKSNKIT